MLIYKWQLINLDIILIFCAILSGILIWSKWWKISRIFVTFFSIFIFITGVSPLPDLLMTYLENRYPQPKKIDKDVKGFIIVGFGIDRRISEARHTPTFNCAAERVTYLVELANQYPDKKIVFTAGNPENGSKVTIASVAKDFYKNMTGKEPPSNIIFDDKSETTFQCAENTYNLIHPEPEDKWVLVTSAAHLPRAMGAFQSVGWKKLIPYPIDYRTTGQYNINFGFSIYHGLMTWSIVTYEIIGILYYRLTGLTKKIIPTAVVD